MKVRSSKNILRVSAAAITTLGIALLSISAHAGTITVVNGGFEDVAVAGSSAQFGAGQTQQVTGWTTTGYNFVYAPGTGDTTGSTNGVYFWGPGNPGGGPANGFVDPSPAGGNYIAADGAYQTEAISQVITGLTPGEEVTVGFWWAGAQQHGFDGVNTEQWIVSLGSETHKTSVYTNPSHGFSGWQYVTMTFTPTSASETLSFLADGTPTGVPPFSLLDGLTVTNVTPEPSSFALLFTGIAGVGGIVRSRFKKNVL